MWMLKTVAVHYGDITVAAAAWVKLTKSTKHDWNKKRGPSSG